MRTIKRIFLDDILSLAKNFFALVITIGICFLPALYAWFNIYSNWDPYGNTAGLMLAAISVDKGYTDDNGEYHNQGDTIIENLKDNHSVNWQFVQTEDEAINGVYSGKYYAAVVIDEDFTYNMYNIFADDATQPTLIFYENQKKNAVANKINDTVVSTLQNNINKAFIEVVITEVFSGASDVYGEMDEEGGIDGIVDKLKALNEDLDGYENTIDSIIAADTALKSSLESAKGDTKNLESKTKASASSIAETNNEVAQTQVTLASFQGDVNTCLDSIQANLDEMEDTLEASKVSTDAADMGKAMKKVNGNLDTISTNLVAIAKATETVQNAEKAASDATKTAQKTAMDNAKTDMDSKETDYEAAKTAYQTAKDAYDTAYAADPDSAATTAAKTAMDDAKTAMDNAETAYKVSQATYNAAKTAYEGTSSEEIATTVDEMQSFVTTMNSLFKQYASDAAIDATTKAVATGQKSAVNAIDEALDDVETLDSDLNNKLIPQMNGVIDNLEAVLTNSTDMLNSMSETFGKMTTMFTSLQTTLDSANNSLEKTNEALSYVNDKLADTINKIESAESTDQVEMLVNTLSGDPDTYGSFFSEPVQMETEAVYPIENYGSAVAPFYTTLAIWVGALILTAIIKVKPSKEKYPDATPEELYFGRYALYWVLGQVQALIIVFGDVQIFGIQCLHPGWFTLAACCTATVFGLFIYSLVVTWGDVGKALSVVIVVLQIAGSSGTYPIELLPEFFQKVYIFFPFPYAINAMRECICGMYEMDYLIYLLELGIFLIVSLVIGLLLRIPFEGINHYFEERMEDTEMM